MATSKQQGKKRVKKAVSVGIVHIRSTFNNTLVSVTDVNGNVVAWASAGVRGFRGSRKSTPFAAQLAADEACRRAQDHGMQTCSIRISGPGAGRESALRGVQSSGMRVSSIKDVTPIPHNGCRPPKRRRV
jgi:small subunit ribosomal protein S11